MNTPRQKMITWSALAIPAIALLLPIGACAQATAPADASETPGLDSLIKDNEPKLIDELSADGLDTLLHREFDVDNTPKDQRDAIESLNSLHQLSDPTLQLSARQRLDLMTEAAVGLQAAKNMLPKDAARLENYAAQLIDGATYYQSTLEYWGESPQTQAQLKPIADTICDLYKMASDAAEEECGVAAAANNLPKARDLDNESTTDTYAGSLFQYDRALATDASTPVGKAARKAICDAAVPILQQYDNATSTVQALVELNIAKLQMLEGNTAAATALFDNVAANRTTPPATPQQQNDGHYFKAVALVIGKDLAGAKQALADTKTFQQTLPDLLAKANMPKAQITDFMKEADTDNQLLQYRIDMLDAELAKAPADKDKANSAAVAVLVDLSKKRPDLQGLIYEQLVNCLPPNQPVAGMDPLLLQAVMNKGTVEYHKPAAQRDKAIMQRGLDAAKEVLARKNQTGIAPEFTLAAARLVPVLQEALGQNLDAINGYLDFADKYKAVPKEEPEADGMLRSAYKLVNLEGKDLPGPTYERFLKIAIDPPFNYTMFDYDYGRTLQGRSDLAGAADTFKRVPPTDAHYADARYQLMLVDQKLVDTPTRDAAAHAALVNELATVAIEIKNRYANSTNKVDRFKAAYATLIAAELAVNDQNDPKTALALLENFEKSVSGQDQEKAFIVKALFIRYSCHVALKQTDLINQDLVAIVNNAPGDTGIKLVHDQLLDLEAQFDKAQANNDIPHMRQYARMEAQLSGYLANWAKNNTNPANKKAYYSYAVFDAKIKRIAGTLEDDPATKQALLKEALEQYDFLASKAGHDLYVAQLDPQKVASGEIDPSKPDVYVDFGRALTQYELHDYLDAQATLGLLLNNNRLGDTSSDPHWEATYKLYDTNYELAQQGNADAKKNLDQTKTGLKSIYIIGGIPPKWQSQFDALRHKLLPDWTPPLPDGGTAPQSASTKSP